MNPEAWAFREAAAALASLLHIPANTDAEQTAALIATLRATTSADDLARMRAVIFGEGAS